MIEPGDTDESSASSSQNFREDVSEVKPDPTRIQAILDTSLTGKQVNGTVSVEDLQRTFEQGNGEGFPYEDGYFHLTTSGTLAEGDLVRIKTTPDGKTLWYPTNVTNLSEAVKSAKRKIKRISGDEVFSRFEELKAEGADINALLNQKEEEAIRSYKVIDFGCGDARMPMVAAANGLPGIGIEVDEELLQMAATNIDSAKRAGLLSAPAGIVAGSFFDNDVLNRAFNGTPDRPNSICYLYTAPNTWRLLPLLMPHLKSNDLLVTYKEKLTRAPEFEQIADRIKAKDESFLFETPVNIYTVK
jgi:hypothetical protein